ncbi:MAG TPA: hypothetical protein VGI08_00950, partial [Diaminobutyricibacter sp.]
MAWPESGPRVHQPGPERARTSSASDSKLTDGEVDAEPLLGSRHHKLWGLVAVVSALALGIAQAVVFVPAADAFAQAKPAAISTSSAPTLVPVAGPPTVVPKTVQVTTPVTQQAPTRTTTVVRRVSINPQVLAAILA